MIQRKAYIEKIRPFMGKNIIKVLIGVRRSGKSTLLKLIKEDMIASEENGGTMLYVDFESIQYRKLTNEESLVRFVSENIDSRKKATLFFDEIQEVEGWEKALRSFMVDYDADIYVTGSNARLLSSDLATYITGRYVQIPVLPFSFSEFFEAFRELGLSQDSRSVFARYAEQGGFPFQVELGFDKEASMQYLNDVYSSILLRDIVQKHAFRDVEYLMRIMQYVLAEAGHSFSAKSISDYLRSDRKTIAVDTVYGYLHAAEEACLLYRAGREDAVGKRALKFNEKFYIVDHGLREALGFSNIASIDQILENIVYLELIRRGYAVTVGKVGDREVDFIAKRGTETEYYQVSYLLATDEVRDREFASLEALDDNYPKYVLSLDEFPSERKGIRSANLIDWLLGDASIGGK